jgi:hypothetical protein
MSLRIKRFLSNEIATDRDGFITITVMIAYQLDQGRKELDKETFNTAQKDL